MKRLLAGAILLAAIAVPTVLFATQGQETEARINARQLEDGRIEFAMQVREGDGWSDRLLPRGRYFPANATVGKWLNSTTVGLSVNSGRAPFPVSTNGWSYDRGDIRIFAGPFNDLHRFRSILEIDGEPSIAGVRSAVMKLSCEASLQYGDELWDPNGWIQVHLYSDEAQRDTIAVLNVVRFEGIRYVRESGPFDSYKTHEIEESTLVELHFEGANDFARAMEQMREWDDIRLWYTSDVGDFTVTFSDIASRLSTPIEPNFTYCGTY